MDSYVVIVVDDSSKAFRGLHALWDLDARGDLTVRGAVVVSRDRWGHVDVQTPAKHECVEHDGIGVGIGLLLGGLACANGGLSIPNGACAIIAEIWEGSPEPLDALAGSLDGQLLRQNKTNVDGQFSSDYSDYLYPYDYRAETA